MFVPPRLSFSSFGEYRKFWFRIKLDLGLTPAKSLQMGIRPIPATPWNAIEIPWFQGDFERSRSETGFDLGNSIDIVVIISQALFWSPFSTGSAIRLSLSPLEIAI